MYTSYRKINSKYIEDLANKIGQRQSDIGVIIGRSATFLPRCLTRGDMSMRDIKALAALFKVPVEKILAVEPEPEKKRGLEWVYPKSTVKESTAPASEKDILSIALEIRESILSDISRLQKERDAAFEDSLLRLNDSIHDLDVRIDVLTSSVRGLVRAQCDEEPSKKKHGWFSSLRA